MKKSMFALVATVVVQVATAQGYPVLGVGTQSCGKWTQDMPRSGRVADGEMSFANLSWVQGFITGMNAAFGVAGRKYVGVKGMPDSAAMAAFITKHCTERPLDDVQDAAAALYLEILSRSGGK